MAAPAAGCDPLRVLFPLSTSIHRASRQHRSVGGWWRRAGRQQAYCVDTHRGHLQPPGKRLPLNVCGQGTPQNTWMWVVVAASLLHALPATAGSKTRGARQRRDAPCASGQTLLSQTRGLQVPWLTSRNPASTTCHRACNTLSTIRLLLGPCPLAVALPAHPPPAAEVTGCTSPYPKQAAGPYIKHVYPPLLYTQQHPTPPQAVQWVLANKLCQG